MGYNFSPTFGQKPSQCLMCVPFDEKQHKHAGRGGWTWYTGSAGWLYRLITESFLGLQQEANKLKIIPCVPKEWKSFKVHYRYKNTMYHIEVIRILADEKMIVTVDGVEKDENMITLIDDGAEHNVVVADNKKLKMPLKINALKLINYKAVP